MVEGEVHIHAPSSTAKEAQVVDCPSCKAAKKQSNRSLHLMFFTPWYGWSRTCIRCGRVWEDSEWMPLMFYRNARRDNIDSAKRRWRKSPPVEENHFGLDQ